MTLTYWRQMALTSITDPALAARVLMAQKVPRQALWAGLVLVAVLNALLFGISNLMVPGPSPLPPLFQAPLVYCAVVTGGLVLTVHVIYRIGRLMGGTGTLADVLVLLVWMQALRVLVQAAALVLLVTIPLLSALLIFAAGLVGLYMLVHFVDQAHRFGSALRAAGVLIASVLAIVLGLSLLLALVAGPNMGSSAYV